MRLAAERSGSERHAWRGSQLPAGDFVQHFRDELNDVCVADDGPEEEVCDKGRRDGFQGGGNQQNAGKAALVLRMQGPQDLLKCSLGFPLEALDVQGGSQPWDVGIKENGSLQVGVFLGAQVQAPEGVEAALQPLHGGQRGLRPLGLLPFALAIEEDLLEHAGGRGLHHLKRHHLLRQPQEEEGDPAAVQQQELVPSWQQVEGREVFHEADGFHQHVGGSLAGDVGCPEAHRPALVAQAALVGRAAATPAVVQVLAEESVKDGGAVVLLLALTPLAVHVHAAARHG